MYQFILLIHIFAAALMIFFILIQQGKGAAMGAAFGSGASQTVFGSRGSGSFLFRLTIGLMLIFFVTSISLNYLATHAYKQQKLISLPIPTKTQSSPPSIGHLPPVPSSNAPVNEIPTRK